MNFKLDKHYLNKLIETREENILINNIYNDFLENYSRTITKEDLSYFSSYYELFLDKLEIDPFDKDFQHLAKKYNLSEFKKLDETKYLNNPYYQKIKLNKEVKEGNLTLKESLLPSFSAFIYKDISVKSEDYYREINHFAYFDKPFKYLELREKDVTWMSVTPHEIETMEESLKEVKGNVLVLGLGIGYYPYMASLKNDVFKIDIVELDQKIINLFKNNLLNQFEHKEKINLFKEEAYKYLKENDLTIYDYIFVDLWHTPEDALSLYLKIAKLLSTFKGKVSYWIEKSIIALIRRYLITLIEEKLNGYTEKDYLVSENENDQIINYFYQISKNENISSCEEMNEFLSDENIKNLITK